LVREYKLKTSCYSYWLILKFQVEEQSLKIISFEPFIPYSIGTDITDFVTMYDFYILLSYSLRKRMPFDLSWVPILYWKLCNKKEWAHDISKCIL
jgi:hypothetical protein